MYIAIIQILILIFEIIGWNLTSYLFLKGKYLRKSTNTVYFGILFWFKGLKKISKVDVKIGKYKVIWIFDM